MKSEFETKVLDIDVSALIQKLEKIWATLNSRETLMRRWVFDIESHHGGAGKRIRLRQQRDKTTLTYKDRSGNEIWATKEIETWVENFDDMAAILQMVDWKMMAYQENRRIVYIYDNIEICIDSRPKIPTYVEIEWPNVEEVERMLEQLGLQGKDVGDMGVVEIYEKYGLDLHSYKVLKFEE